MILPCGSISASLGKELYMFIKVNKAKVDGYVSTRPFVLNTDHILYAYPLVSTEDGSVSVKDAASTNEIEAVFANGKRIIIELSKSDFCVFAEILCAPQTITVANTKCDNGSYRAFKISE